MENDVIEYRLKRWLTHGTDYVPLGIKTLDHAYAEKRRHELFADVTDVRLESRTTSPWKTVTVTPWVAVTADELLPGWGLHPENPLHWRVISDGYVELRGAVVPLDGCDRESPVFVLPEGRRPIERYERTSFLGGGDEDDWMESIRHVVETDGRVFAPVVTRFKREWVPAT